VRPSRVMGAARGGRKSDDDSKKAGKCSRPIVRFYRDLALKRGLRALLISLTARLRRVDELLLILEIAGGAFFLSFLLLLRSGLEHYRQVRRLFDLKFVAPHRVMNRLGSGGDFFSQ
jgi:hypothetical protein